MIETIINFMFLGAILFILLYILWYGISIHTGAIHVELYGIAKHFR